MNNIRRPQPTPAQRVANALQSVNQPVACKKCGGVFFMEIKAQMYTAGSYGLRSVSTQAMSVYQCPCGEFLLPPNQVAPAGTERDIFARSMQASLKVRSTNATPLDQVAENVAGIHELKALQEKVEELAAQVEQLGGAKVDLSSISLPPVTESDSQGTYEAEGVTDYVEEEPEQERTVFAGARKEELTNMPPVATGRRGRSMASAISPVGEANVKMVEGDSRKPTPGGARAMMRRQGRGQA